MDEPQFDASSIPPWSSGTRRSASDGRVEIDPPGRPFLGIRFDCCRTYGRIYRNDEKTAYVGRCPKCLARVSVPIGSGGTSSRFFSAG